MIEIEPGTDYRVLFRGRKRAQRVRVRRVFDSFGIGADGSFQRFGVPCLVYEVCMMRNQPGPDRFQSLDNVVEIEVVR